MEELAVSMKIIMYFFLYVSKYPIPFLFIGYCINLNVRYIKSAIKHCSSKATSNIWVHFCKMGMGRAQMQAIILIKGEKKLRSVKDLTN